MITISRRVVAAGAGAVFALAGVAGASAHVVQQFGTYSIAIGWLHEPTYVGVVNAVQAIVKDAKDNPVSDLPDDSLKVTVSTGGTTSSSMSLVSSFDPDTGLGTPGEYLATLIPTAPGIYTFHLTGDIKGNKVDQSFTSSDKTFDNVDDPSTSNVEFPAKVPAVSALTTELGRIGARVDAAQSSAKAAQSSATDAHDAATRGMVIGIIALVAGIVIGGAGVGLALRRRTT